MEKFVPACVAPAVFNDKAAFLLELSLQRSCNADLRIEISDVRDIRVVEEERKSFLVSVAPLLLRTTSRWGHLFISGFPDFIEIFSACTLERLQSLEMFLFKEQRILFPNVPKLTELVIDSQKGGVRSIELPWSGIRSFATPISGLIHLPYMQNLEKLHIGPGRDYPTQAIDISELYHLSSFVLPFLHTITMHDLSTDLVLQLFSRIHASALHTLDLRLTKLPQCCRLQFDGMENLKTLSLYCRTDASSDATIAFLSRMPSVETAILGPGTATPAVMRAIGRGVLPKLGTVAFHIYDISMGKEDLLALLEERACSDVSQGAMALTAITELRLAQFGKWKDSDYASGKLLPVDAIMNNAGLSGRWEVHRDMIKIRYIEMP